jgi:hypothetical protein
VECHRGQHGEEAEGVYETEEDEARLKLVLGDLLSQPLDRAKPLWMVYDIQGFADGSSALFVKIHVRKAEADHLLVLTWTVSLLNSPDTSQHCIADGQGSIRAVLTMASSEEGADLRQMQYGQAEKQLRELEQAANNNPGGGTLAIAVSRPHCSHSCGAHTSHQRPTRSGRRAEARRWRHWRGRR